jgi:hypothetical protein
MTIDIEMHAAPGEEKCDFCSSREVAWSYPAADFDFPMAGWGSIGAWAACDLCSTLIEAGDWTGLLDRSIESYGVIRHAKTIRPRLAKLHQDFAAARLGDRVPF